MAKTKRLEKDIKVSAKVLRKCFVSSLILLWQPKLAQSALSSMVSRYKHFCVLQKIKKLKMSAIFGETKIFGKLAWLLCRDTQQVKNFVEFAPYSTVFEI